jgi:hypothetical protein
MDASVKLRVLARTLPLEMAVETWEVRDAADCDRKMVEG